MVSFALITEGKTDQAVLRNILIGIYGSDVEVNGLQPLYDATDSNRVQAESFGNWELVFEFCKYANFDDIYMENDYVIIQIDTDMGEHVNFGIPLTHDGIDRRVEDLVDDVRNKIISHIDQVSYQQYKSQFKFAISVHSLECWLLPLYAKSNTHSSKMKNCSKQLERDANRHGIEYKKEYRPYDNLSSQFRKPKVLVKAKQHQQSLALFLDSLPQH